jgi:hypothetical protein
MISVAQRQSARFYVGKAEHEPYENLLVHRGRPRQTKAKSGSPKQGNSSNLAIRSQQQKIKADLQLQSNVSSTKNHMSRPRTARAILEQLDGENRRLHLCSQQITQRTRLAKDKVHRQRLHVGRHQQMLPLASKAAAMVSQLQQSCPSDRSQREPAYSASDTLREYSQDSSLDTGADRSITSEKDRDLCSGCGREDY